MKLSLNYSMIQSPVLERLHERGLSLGIVSDAWPSLEKKIQIARSTGITFRHSSFQPKWDAVNQTKGITRRAVDELGLSPDNLLFVDDCPANVEKAIELALNGILMVRSGVPADVDLDWVSNLEEIETLL